jgi:FkbM family methyltransferase
MTNTLKERLRWRALLPLEWSKDLLRVGRSSLPRALKREVVRTLTALYLRRLCKNVHQATECRVLNFQFAAFSLDAVAFLYKEIFISLEYFFETRNDRPYIIDCGSNIGMSILFFKTIYPKAVVVGFEPASDSFKLLKRNVETNKLADVTVHQAALGQTEGKVKFFLEDKPGGFVASTDVRRASDREETVEQVCLSEFIDREVDFLKLDVEGAEKEVLDDLASSRCLRRIKEMVIEYHHHLEEGEDRFSEFLAHLEQNGFGYLLRSDLGPTRLRGRFQDFLVYAYRKD